MSKILLAPSLPYIATFMIAASLPGCTGTPQNPGGEAKARGRISFATYAQVGAGAAFPEGVAAVTVTLRAAGGEEISRTLNDPSSEFAFEVDPGLATFTGEGAATDGTVLYDGRATVRLVAGDNDVSLILRPTGATLTPPDAGVILDAGSPDAGVILDAGIPDAGIPDAGLPDAGAPDAGIAEDAGTGEDAGEDAGIVEPQFYTIGGTVAGLVGTGLVLTLNDAHDLPIASDGPFAFAEQVLDGGAYAVTVKTDPEKPHQTCRVTLGQGSVRGAEVTDILVTCVATVFSPYVSGRNWGVRIRNDGATLLTASETPCDGTETQGPAGCLHAGAVRAFDATGYATCSGLSATDINGWFTWACDDSTGQARMYTTSFKNGLGLRDLIDTSATLKFKTNSLELFDQAIQGSVLTTPAEVWWNNTFANADAGGSLTVAGQIGVVRNDAAANITFGADNTALVIAAGKKLTGKNKAVAVVTAEGRRSIWIEGDINAAGAAAGLYLKSTAASVVQNVTVYGGPAGSEPVDVYLDGSSGNILDNVASVASGAHGVLLLGGSNRNLLTNLRVAQATKIGLYLDGSNLNHIGFATISGCGQSGLTVTNATGNIFALVTTFANVETAVKLNTAKENAFLGVTAANNAQRGIELASGSTGNLIANALVINSGTAGLYAAGSGSNTYIDLAISTHDERGVSLDTSPDNRFSGKLLLGNNGTGGALFGDCVVIGSGDAGLQTLTCLPTGVSDFTKSLGARFDSSLRGKVQTDDAQNTSDTNGAAALAALTDWTAFESPCRGWGTDGPAFPATLNRGPCTSDCRIWDWRIPAGDRTLLDALAAPTSDTVLPPLTGALAQTALLHAVELVGDGRGDDDFLCESGEHCVHLRNFGAYQGQITESPGTELPAGKVTGVTLSKWPD